MDLTATSILTSPSLEWPCTRSHAAATDQLARLIDAKAGKRLGNVAGVFPYD